MKRFALLLLAAAQAAFATAFAASQPKPASADTNAPRVEKTEFSVKRGVNIAHWVSQTGARGEERARIFTENDIKQLAAWGFDHIRIPVGEEQILHTDGTLDDETLALIEKGIELCRKHGLRVIFDLHNIKAHHFNASHNALWSSPEAQQQLCDLWTKLAKRFDKFPPELLAFELLNEPVADNNDDWNKLLAKLLPAVREVNARRVILVASNKWNSVDNIPAVTLPDNDPNIMLTFHFYEPFILTHYQASWTDQKDLRLEHGVNYPGRPVDPADIAKLTPEQQKAFGWWSTQMCNKEWMKKRWEKAVAFARQKGLTLYLGEFGCLPTVGEKSRLAWTNDVTSLCNELGIPRAYWEYKSGFGFADWKTGRLTNAALLEALVK